MILHIVHVLLRFKHACIMLVKQCQQTLPTDGPLEYCKNDYFGSMNVWQFPNQISKIVEWKLGQFFPLQMTGKQHV
jgi:hypothetical protein